MTATEKVRRLVEDGLGIGDPRAAGPLTVIGLFGGEPAKEYVVAQQAFADGTLVIGELDGGTVPQLEAFNEGKLPVLLLDGEHLKGARQDRIVNASILLAPEARTLLPVSCVEQGRWHYEGDEGFAPGEEISYARLRGMNAQSRSISARHGEGRSVDQHAVWQDIAAKHDELGVGPSETGAMTDAFDSHGDELDRIVRALATPEPGQTGALALVGGKPVALDSFDRPEAFAALWGRLLRGYALEALGAPKGEDDPVAVQTFLANAASAQMSETPGVGLGTDVVMTSSRIVGNALEWGEGIVHVALFPTEPGADRDTSGAIERPSERRLRRMA